MAIISHGTLKLFLLSTGVFSIAVILNLYMPLIMEFTLSDIPSIWSFILSCLKPPYLYLVINCIIITIVASSKFQSRASEPSAVSDSVVSVRPEPVKASPVLAADYAVRPVDEFGFGEILSVAKVADDFPADYAVGPVDEFGFGEILSVAKVADDFPADYAAMREAEFGYGVISSVVKVPEYDLSGNVDARISETENVTTVNVSDEMNGKDEIVISRSSLTPVRKPLTEHSVSTHKSPRSARFAHRKSVKASPEVGRALRVSKPKRHDTLETTWKTITDGRPMPLTRHLRKSDTMETNGRHHVPQPEKEHNQKMTKSETFNDQSSAGRSNKSLLSPSPGSGKLRKEPSLSQDDLNRRVEAFINKFNEDMRLQRQESLNQYMEMINRGAH